MVPNVSNINNFTPVQTSLVATSIPDTAALRVPVTNVAPTVSSVQVNNNASSNNGGVFSFETSAAVSAGTIPSVPPANLRAGLAGGAPATFLAQLIGQDVPVAFQQSVASVLAGYEQLAALSFVKYKPSNASLPPPPPIGVFGRILQQQKAVALVSPVPLRSSLPPQATDIESAVAISASPPAAIILPRPVEVANKPIVPAEEFADEVVDVPALAIVPSPSPQLSVAYSATVARNNNNALAFGSLGESV